MILLALAFATTSTAQEPEEWRSWIDSPEAYFATESERIEWDEIESEDAARRFIESYFEKRGKGFRKELEWRIGLADEHLSWKDVPGSKRLQGKLVILLGQPTSILKRNDSEIGRPHIGIPGTVPSNVSQVNLAYMKAADDLYTYRFSDEDLLGLIHVEGALLVHVAVDTSTGEEEIPDRNERERLDRIFGLIAAGSIVE